MQRLIEIATAVAERLRARNATVAVAESSSAGLISAALLAVPGASGYFLGGAVAYTRPAKQRYVGVTEQDAALARPATEIHALILARRAREALGATWGIGETGAAGPTGNRYGDPAGHCCIALAGPAERALTVRTGSADRYANMQAFSAAALDLLLDALRAQL